MLMRYRPKGSPADDPRLGRYIPDDWKHVERFPLQNLPRREQPKKVGVVIGVNWYPIFNRPVKHSNAWWIEDRPRASWGSVEGGHAIALVPIGQYESWRHYLYYDQVNQGICTAMAGCRIQSFANGKLYQPRPLYDIIQRLDEWEGEEPTYSGSSVNATMKAMHQFGLIPRLRAERHSLFKSEITRAPVLEEGISAYRWITSVDELDAVLGLKGREWAYWSNSWGSSYPRRVRVPLSVLDVLLGEYGEMAVATDR